MDIQIDNGIMPIADHTAFQIIITVFFLRVCRIWEANHDAAVRQVSAADNASFSHSRVTPIRAIMAPRVPPCLVPTTAHALPDTPDSSATWTWMNVPRILALMVSILMKCLTFNFI